MKTTLETSGEDVKTTLETSGEDAKTALETSGEDAKTTLETRGEDAKTALETSEEDAKIHSKRVENSPGGPWVFAPGTDEVRALGTSSPLVWSVEREDEWINSGVKLEDI